MNNLCPADLSSVERALRTLESGLGPRLQNAVLCGEAASRDYRAGRSPLTIALVIDRVDSSALDSLRPHIAGWRRQRIATPLLFDRAYIETSLDVFPLEFLDLGDRYVSLFGSDAVFTGLAIEKQQVRFELEEQLRGKLLHLWESYLESRSLRSLRKTLTDSTTYFHVLLRGMLFLASAARPAEFLPLRAAVTKAYGVELPGLSRLDAARVGAASLPTGEVRAVFDMYLEEVRSLLRTVDRS